MTDKPRLLLIEDEDHLASGLKLNFELEGYRVDVAGTLRQGASLLLGEKYAAIVLDVMLPDGDGFELCKRLRDSGNYTPVIMLTAKSDANDRISGLNAGADDYLPKPFELSELLARVRSLLRRRSWEEQRAPQTEELVFGAVRINFDSQEASRGGSPVRLTQLELDLMRYFASNVGRVLSRDELLEKVWKLRNYPNTRTVDNFIVRLRKYFEPDPEKPVHFVSHRGSGYKFIRRP